VDAAQKGLPVKIGAVTILIPRHIIRGLRVMFDNAFFYFILCKRENIRAAYSPA
jgi:hypothetical protein